MIDIIKSWFTGVVNKTIDLVEESNMTEEEIEIRNKTREIKKNAIEFFRLGRISSLNIDGETVYKFSKLPEDVMDDDVVVTFNKKFVSLFIGEEDFVLENFVKSTDKIIKRKNGDLMTVGVTQHARERFISRYLIIRYLYMDRMEGYFTRIKTIDQALLEYFENFMSTFVYSCDVQATIRNFSRTYRDEINSVIQAFMSVSNLRVKIPKLLRNRSEANKNRSLYYEDGLFNYVYGTSKGNIITVELLKSGKKGCLPGPLVKYINGNTDSLLTTVLYRVINEQRLKRGELNEL